MRELLRGEYLDPKENVLFFGNPGTGKTNLVCALAFSACAHGRSVRFHTATDLVTQLVGCREEKRLQHLHKHLQRLHLLVIDELGYVPFSKAGAELLFEVISWAYEHHSLMLTTNMAFEEWTMVFISERPSGAHAPVPHPGSQWGKLPAATGQKKISLGTLITAGLKPKRKGQIT